MLILSCSSKPDEQMDISTPAEGRELMQKQRGDMLVEMALPCIPPRPLVQPQASTPVSQSAPTFFPGSLPIPSQPEFSHVRVHVYSFSEAIYIASYSTGYMADAEYAFESTSVLLC